MVEDSEDTIVRPRRPERVAAMSDVDALADTVVAPPPLLVEPPEPPLAPRPLSGSAPAPTKRPSFVAPTEHPPAAPVTVPLCRIRVGASEFSLEAPAFVGRHPSTPRVLGSRAVRLVRVLSPNREVSATHASFKQEGSSVVVTDLGSTNGTVVAASGADP
ncbi:MAG TPA: FHA domain-containing protein, partial [Terrimesophilobacter sp.]|nr:FHA domain-containing protein [Terrimesophilobacter sp.]